MDNHSSRPGECRRSVAEPHRINDRMRFSLKTLASVVAVSAVLTVAGIWGYRLINGQSVAGHTAVTANRVFGSRLTIPDSATDINFYYDLCWIEADFAISEQAFLTWCKEQGWSPITVDENAEIVFKPARTALDTNSVSIHSGYTFQTPNGAGAYDRNTGRAFIHHYDC